MMFNVQYSLICNFDECSMLSIFNVDQCSMFNGQSSLFNVQCSIFNVWCLMLIVQCSMFNCSMFIDQYCSMFIDQYCSMFNIVQCSIFWQEECTSVHCWINWWKTRSNFGLFSCSHVGEHAREAERIPKTGREN